MRKIFFTFCLIASLASFAKISDLSKIETYICDNDTTENKSANEIIKNDNKQTPKDRFSVSSNTNIDKNTMPIDKSPEIILKNNVITYVFNHTGYTMQAEYYFDENGTMSKIYSKLIPGSITDLNTMIAFSGLSCIDVPEDYTKDENNNCYVIERSVDAIPMEMRQYDVFLETLIDANKSINIANQKNSDFIADR